MAKRGRGEGTIRYRASDGRWEAAVTLGTQRKSFYGKTRRQDAAGGDGEVADGAARL
ncbi:MAG: hypothetical protein ACRDID_07655 [Ktedonobacterales bacterium]